MNSPFVSILGKRSIEAILLINTMEFFNNSNTLFDYRFFFFDRTLKTIGSNRKIQSIYWDN